MDIGSETLHDRSKSMKTFVMDLFERYGDGEANIEGIDQYQACYGGQAATLNVLHWVESDRWDGRYGLGIATDISDVPSIALFAAGAACSIALVFPDAPLAHHSQRASCIQHRCDFFKPVGWFHMGAVVDNKYSIDAYMQCIDTCHDNLHKKLGGQRVCHDVNYCVFHTGGGYHIVKKAFERLLRNDSPELANAERQIMHENMLMPGVWILKIIGPVHTVSSFLNTSSVIMTEWEKAIGKVISVFTYGSGCAASMYKMRFDDLLWMCPMGQWKQQFYRNAIKVNPDTKLMDAYVDTWMKFDWTPTGRQDNGIDPWMAEPDAYKLMEVDPWGRRFYCKGGIIGDPLPKNERMLIDQQECRKMRQHYGPKPPRPEDQVTKALVDTWKEIELEMVYSYDDSFGEIVQEGIDNKNRDHKLIFTSFAEPSKPNSIEKDDRKHTYSIVGSWSGGSVAHEMTPRGKDVWTYDVTIGENAFEKFYLIQDNNWKRMIYPAFADSWKSLPCVGPHDKNKDGMRWLIDSRWRKGTPVEDMGKVGDKYRVTFSWKTAKNVAWEKLEGETGVVKALSPLFGKSPVSWEPSTTSASTVMAWTPTTCSSHGPQLGRGSLSNPRRATS